MEYLSSLANNFLLLLNAMSIYILFGLLIAGVLKQFIPENFIEKHLGSGSVSSVVKSTVLGIPLPICSCSVIPLAQSLRKEGASKGSVQSFLISSPITGVDSILATYSFFGIFFTLYRLLSSIIIAILVGIIQNIIEKDDEDFKNAEDSCSCKKLNSTKNKEKFSLKEVFIYAYVILFKDMAKPLFLGLLLGTVFTTFAPKEYTSLLFANEFLTYIVIMIFAIPLYVCATASLPIAASFVMLGMSGGAAFIFLTAGPATSAVTMSVVYKMLGKKSLIIYVGSIMILSFIFAYIFDNIFYNLELLSNIPNSIDEYSFLSQFASMIILLLIFYYLIVDKIKSKKNINSSCKKNLKFTVKEKNKNFNFRVNK